ncbi:acetyl-CoA carboxylase biotin carboxyl carrier protein subunit [Corynebacterium ulceribovis]|uniref:acetyl-CoA carboxylase biotin carboxyl carrier protein subunit n=1 Tax=Corynebacterium ulceribovis TaxID=487732 RepID=UPI000380CD4F|nr:acetyl-CoA carboxylase biotin carboxyl carrier protein subunit [Corynebacterium ulceribovis]
MNICAPFAGIVHLEVAEGDTVDTGQTIAVVETVKLQAPVVAPGPGTIAAINVANFADVTGGDVLLELK